MAAHIFNKDQHLLTLEQRAAMDRAGRLVGTLLQPNGVHNAVQRGLRQGGRRQLQLVDLGHQVAKDAALATARGDYFFGGTGFNV